MNSRSRTTGTRKTNARRKKPATIDLEAREVKASPDPQKSKDAQSKVEATAGKPAKTVSSQDLKTGSIDKTGNEFGRPDNAPAGKSASRSTSSEKTKKSQPTSSKPKITDNTPLDGAGVENQRSGITSGLIGAAAAVLGLGVIGQFEVAKNIPLIGSLYSENEPQEALPANDKKIAELQSQLDQLIIKSERPANISEETFARLDSVEENISDLKDRISSAVSVIDEGPLNPELATALDAITERLDALEINTPDRSTIGEVNSGAIQERISAFEEKLNKNEALVSEIQRIVAANAEQLQSIDTQASSLATSIASVKASEKIALSVAIKALGTALENDEPILSAVASIETFTGTTPESQSLRKLAEDGIPSQNMLLAALEKFIENTQNPPRDTSSGNITERFWANARNLVSFRSSGPQEGDAPVAILSRVKANLENGNYNEVVSEWNKLPANIIQRGTFWTEMLDKKLEALELYEKLAVQIEPKAGQ